MIRKTILVLHLLFIILNTSFSQTVTATQTDSLVGDHQTIGIANPNDTVRYKTTISVSGATANGVNFSNPIPTNTTQVGTVRTSALCRDDVFATSFNTLLNTGNVLTNDYGLPGVSVVTFGTTMSGGTTTMAGNAGTTNGGGTLTLNANGTFNYQPMMGFSGMDQFTYIATTGVAGLQNGSATVTINVATDITFTTVDVSPTCNGASTGSITFMASGGTGTLTYSITGAAGPYQISPTFLLLSAGTYNLAVKDAVGYIKTGTTTLTNPPLITFTTMDVDNVCNGDMTGSITFNASGGTGALQYSINGVGGPYQMGTAFTGLAANTYNLAVRDANNCTVTGTATISQPTAVTFTFTKTDITCNGAGNGSIVFNTTSGGTSPYTYSINGTMGTFTGMTSYTGLSANTYNLVAKDNLGCNSAVQSTTVIEPAAIVVSGTIPNLTYNVAMSNAPFTKTGGSGSPATPWAASGLPTGVNINTSTGIVNGTPTQTGMFTATITYIDANGCTDDIMVSFTVAPRLLNESYAVVGNTQLVSDGHSTPTTPNTTSATNILSNDQSDAAITVTAGTFATTNMGGSIIIGADGKFTYSPPAGSTATDSYTYTGTSNGVSATATITFNIANMVWYVNNTFGGAADGRSHAPFTTGNAAAAAANLANDIIYVHTGSGNTTGNIPLDASQTLRGAGNALSVGALTILAGTKPTLTGTVTLANSVTVDGFDMNTGASTAIASSGATSVSVSIGNVTSSGAVNTVTLTNTTGAVVIAGGSITGGAGAPINISGGSVTFTDAGSVSQATASQPLVNIAGGHTGTVTFNTGTLTATNGTGLQFDNADGTYNIFGTCTLNGGDAGVDILNGSSGSFAFTTTNITNPSGTGFNVNSSTPSNISCNGSISKNSAGRLIDITSNSGGTMTFNNTLSSTGASSGILVNSNSGVSISFASSTKTLNTGANTAVSFTSNAGTTANFSNGGLDIDVTSATGFNATGGGTINVTGTGNSITSTTGTALNVSSTTIGASNLNFQSISVNGATKGISLNSTGSSGGLVVSGIGTTDGSGGTIQSISTRGIECISSNNLSLKNMTFTNACTVDFPAGPTGLSLGVNTADNAVIHLQNVTSATLDNIDISGSAEQGINGHNVNGFSLLNSTITSAGNGPDEDGIHFFNMSGTCAITNTSIISSGDDNVNIQNSNIGFTPISTVGTINITNGIFNTGVGGSGILFGIRGTSNTTVNISGVTINNNFSGGVVADTYDTATSDIEVSTCTITNNNDAIQISSHNGNTVYDIHDNSNISLQDFVNISILKSAFSSTGTLSGKIRNNSITTENGHTADGIFVGSFGGNVNKVAITNNTINYAGTQRAILLQGGQDGAAILEATVTGNNIDIQLDGVGNAATGILAQVIVATPGGNGTTMCADIGGAGGLANIFTHSLGGVMAAGDIRVRQRNTGPVKLPGYAGGSGDNAAVVAYLSGRNTVVSTPTATNDDSLFSGGSACQQP